MLIFLFDATKLGNIAELENFVTVLLFGAFMVPILCLLFAFGSGLF
jgi:hypothetical protein